MIGPESIRFKVEKTVKNRYTDEGETERSLRQDRIWPIVHRSLQEILQNSHPQWEISEVIERRLNCKWTETKINENEVN